MKLFATTASAALLAAGTAFAGTMADIDTDASGAVSLEEAQAYDPSVTTEAFGEFDGDADGALNEDEFAAWEADMEATGQGDASMGDETDALEAETGIDADANIDGDADPDAVLDSEAELGVDAETGLDTDLDAE